jgi:DNA-binding transcriptional LysR family regulator
MLKLGDREFETKVRLFERSARGVVRTDEGRAFLPHAREVLDSIDRAAAAAGSYKSGPVGDVRITTPYTFGVTFIAPLLSAFLAAHPGLNVHLELTSRNVNLAEEGFDLAVRIGAAPPGLVAHRLGRNRIRLCASVAYSTQHGEPKTPADLARHPLFCRYRHRSGTGHSRPRGTGARIAGFRAPRMVTAHSGHFSDLSEGTRARAPGQSTRGLPARDDPAEVGILPPQLSGFCRRW